MTAEGGKIANKGERIAKRIADAGLCSRREAERWIEAGRVTVDGKLLDSSALVVTSTSTITVDGRPLPGAQPVRLFRYHKPAGLLTTHNDPQGRRTVFATLPKHLPRVISVGRLDLESEGLLLLTTSGSLARKLEAPANKWERQYRVRAHGRPDKNALAELAKCVTVSGVNYGPVEARLDRQRGANAWITMSLTEGKNRELRKICEHLGLTVNRLIRIAYGPFQLGNLARGEVDEVPHKVVRKQVDA